MRDPENFDEFYAASVRRLTSQLYAMTGDRAEAEDAVQEAFARAWQRRGRVSGYADPEAWVRTVACRISISSWRKAVNRSVAQRRHVPRSGPSELLGLSQARRAAARSRDRPVARCRRGGRSRHMAWQLCDTRARLVEGAAAAGRSCRPACRSAVGRGPNADSALGYRLRVSVAANLCISSGACQSPPSGDAVQWLDGRTWRNLDASAYRDPTRNGEYLGTILLPPRGTVAIRLRLVAGARAPSAYGILTLTLAPAPAPASLPGLARLYPATSLSAHPGIITLG